MAAVDLSSEIVGGIASYKSILNHCVKGQLAVDELRELTGYEGLKGVKSGDTQLRGIIVDKGSSSITFIYNVNLKTASGSEWVFKIDVSAAIFVPTIICGITISVSCSCALVYYCKARKLKKTTKSDCKERLYVPRVSIKEIKAAEEIPMTTRVNPVGNLKEIPICDPNRSITSNSLRSFGQQKVYGEISDTFN